MSKKAQSKNTANSNQKNPGIEEELRRSRDRAEALNRLLSLALQNIPLPELLKEALELILAISWLVFKKRGAVFLLENDQLVMKAQRGLEEPVQKACAGLPLGRCLCGKAVLSGEVQFASSLDERHEISFEGMEPHGHYCVPIKASQKVYGVLNLYLHDGHRYDKKEEDFLIAVADTLAGILERRETEEALVESEHKFKEIFENSNDLIYLHDLEGKIAEVNKIICERLGYSREELLSMSLKDFVSSEYSGLIPGRVKNLLKSGHLVFESADVTIDGTVIPVEISAAIIEYGGKKAVLSIARDIAKRKEYEEALSGLNEKLERQVQERTGELVRVNEELRNNEVRMKKILNSLEMGVVIIDAGTHEIIDANPKALAMFNAPEEAVLGKVCHQYICPTEQGRCPITDLGQAVDFSSERTLITAQGTHLPVLKSVIRTQLGGKDCLVESFVDITDRKQAEEVLRRRLGELEALYTVSSTLRSADNLDEMLTMLLDEALAALNTEAGAICLFHSSSGELRFETTRGWFCQLEGAMLKPGEGIGGKVFASGKAHISREFASDPLMKYAEKVPKNWGGACIPIKLARETVGAFYVAMALPREVTPEEVKLLTSLAEMAGTAVHRLSLYAETASRLRQVQTLRNIDMAITASLDLRVTFNVILDEITGLLKTDAAAIIRLEPHTGSLKYAAWRGFNHSNPAELNLRLGEGFAGRAAMSRESIHVSDLKKVEADKYQGPPFEQEGFMSYFAVPLIAKGLVQGVLEIFHRERLHSDGEWLGFLEALAGQTALAIENAELFHNMERTNFELFQAYDATIEGWAQALDLKDVDTEEHSRRVTETTVAIAKQMNIKDEDLAHLRRGALLHDIGKMGISDSILLKPGKLTDEEWVIMKQHPVYAYSMLAPIDYLKPALDIPYCHHEKFDGSGYPRGLKGKAIPLAARIFAVVDVYDALTSDRPYRKAWSKEETLKHIREGSGKHFDPEVVEVFMSIIENETT